MCCFVMLNTKNSTAPIVGFMILFADLCRLANLQVCALLLGVQVLDPLENTPGNRLKTLFDIEGRLC